LHNILGTDEDQEPFIDFKGIDPSFLASDSVEKIEALTFDQKYTFVERVMSACELLNRAGLTAIMNGTLHCLECSILDKICSLLRFITKD
jgi:hypothetical protein